MFRRSRAEEGQTMIKLREDLHDIFKRSQHLKNIRKCVNEFMKFYKEIYGSPRIEEFMQLVILCIKAVLVSERTSPYTMNSLDFIVLCFKDMLAFEEEKENERLENIVANELKGNASTSMDAESPLEDHEEFDELAAQAFDPDQTIVNSNYMSPISTVDFLIKNYFVKFLVCENCNIRYNTTSLIKKTLDTFSEIDEGTFVYLRNAICDRTFDKEKTIRALACLALEKLQNSEKEDDVLKALKFHLLHDPDATVRLCALKTIEVNSESIKGLYLATRDESNVIRRTAYTKIANQCEISNFSGDDRRTLLMNGIHERVDTVRDVVLTQLIPSWIKRLNGDILQFMEYLNIKKDLHFSEHLLNTYFKSLKKLIEKDDITQFHKLAINFKAQYLDEYQLLTKAPLTEENSFLWLTLCNFCKKNNVTYKKEEREETDNGEEKVVFQEMDLLDEIIPDIPNYCKLIDEYAVKIKTNPSNNSGEEKFVYIQLLKIGKLFSIRDDAQWNYVLTTFKRIIQDDDYFDIFDDYIELMMEIFGNYFGNDHERFLDLLFDLINAINNPQLEGNNAADEDVKRKLEEFESRLNLKYEEKAYAILNKNSEEVARLKPEIDQIVEERQKIMDSQSASELMSNNASPRMDTDGKVFLRCLHIFYGFFNAGKLKKAIDRLPTMINKLILPGLQSNDFKIRTLCVKNLGLYCLPTIELITHFIKVFIEVVDMKSYGETRLEALKFIFDFVCYHGFTNIKFINHDYKNTDIHKSTNFQVDSENILARCNEENFAEVFSYLIDKFLNEPVVDRTQRSFQAMIEYQLFEVTVKGLCKVMELGRFYSNTFLARLVIICYVYKNVEPSLLQIVEGFFLSYAVNFPKLMQEHFGVGNAFVDSYEICLTTVYQDMGLEDKDSAYGDKFINFFTSMIDEKQNVNLVLKAASMLTDEFPQIWALNLKLIDKSDLKHFTVEQFEELSNLLNEFQLNNAPAQAAKKGRSCGKSTGDKNIELAVKIMTRVNNRCSNLKKRKPQQLLYL